MSGERTWSSAVCEAQTPRLAYVMIFNCDNTYRLFLIHLMCLIAGIGQKRKLDK